MTAYFSDLKGFSDVNDTTLNSEIQAGLIEYFDWALLKKGNYYNVSLGETNWDDEDLSLMTLSASADQWTNGQVWNGTNKNWVWQSGIGYSPEPIVGSDHTNPGVSGVYVDSVFYPITTTGVYAHHINYLNGQVIFASPIATGSTVQVEHSYKRITVTYADNLPWYKKILTNEVDEGIIHPNDLLDLPAIALEVVPRRKFQGYQLGGGQWVWTDVIFHCLAEDKGTRDQLVDIVSLQNDKTIYLLDSNMINASGTFPMDYRGVPVSGALRYPDLVSTYNGGKLGLTQTNVQSMQSYNSSIYGGVVRITTEGIKLNI
jgi:hypothetical protein